MLARVPALVPSSTRAEERIDRYMVAGERQGQANKKNESGRGCYIQYPSRIYFLIPVKA